MSDLTRAQLPLDLPYFRCGRCNHRAPKEQFIDKLEELGTWLCPIANCGGDGFDENDEDWDEDEQDLGPW